MTWTIALLTDFGLTDAYVGVMKAVITRLCPGAQLIDLTHAIQPQNVRQAAFTLLNTYRYFAPGTIFLVVVDPGVGGARKAIGAQAGGYTFVGPDNGVLSYALSECDNPTIVELTNPVYQLESVSRTFHGRDIFAPAAAHLAAGVPLHQFGPAVGQITRQMMPRLQISDSQVIGQVMHTDHFGNVITSIGELRWVEAGDQLILMPRLGKTHSPVTLSAENALITINSHTIAAVRHTYSEAKKGEAVALVDSNGYLEIAMNQGSAAAQLGISPGMQIVLHQG